MNKLAMVLVIMGWALAHPVVASDTDGDSADDIATLDPPPQTVRGEDFSFAKSKYDLARYVYMDHPIDFYGGCQYEAQQKLLVPIWESCGFVPRKNPERAKRIEWEHVVPAWVLGHQLQCWQEGGRTNCRTVSAKFREMEADMHNLVPAIGEINGDRSNLPYGMIEGEPRIYGKPNMEIDFKTDVAEPPDNVWGDSARATLYMRDRYGLKLSKADEQLMYAWNNLDPVDAWEKLRNERVTKLQGNDNPYVTNYKKLQRADGKPVTVPTATANTPQTPTNPPRTPNSNPPANEADVVEQLNQWVQNNQSKLPYSVIIVILAGIWWFKQRASKTKAPAKTTKRNTKKG